MPLTVGSPTTGDAVTFAQTARGIFGTVDLVTGAFTEIADNGTMITGGQIAGFGVVDAILYGVNYNQPNGTLYSVNATTGAAALVAPVGIPLGGPEMGAMTYENDVLWGGRNSPSLAGDSSGKASKSGVVTVTIT